MNDIVNQVNSKASVQIKARDLGCQGQDLLIKQLDHVSQTAQAGKKALQGLANHIAVDLPWSGEGTVGHPSSDLVEDTPSDGCPHSMDMV